MEMFNKPLSIFFSCDLGGMNMKVNVETIHQLTIPTPYLVGPVHVYLIEGEKLTLVDTGPLTNEGKHSLETQLKQLGFTLNDIEQVLLTHHHQDHVGLAGFLSHATIIGHRYLQPWLQKDPSFFKHIESFFLQLYQEHGLTGQLLNETMKAVDMYLNEIEKVDVDRFIAEGDDVPGLSGWKVYEVPGHAQSHIMIVREQDNVAIGGDLLLGKISSNALLEAPMEGTARPKTLLQYRSSLKRLKELKLSKVLPGHGAEIEDISTLVDQRLQDHEKRAKVIQEILGNRQLTANEISEELFKEKHKQQTGMTFSETFGHLDFLIDQQAVVHEKQGNVYYFRNR